MYGNTTSIGMKTENDDVLKTLNQQARPPRLSSRWRAGITNPLWG